MQYNKKQSANRMVKRKANNRMDRILYFGADIDLTPVILYPNIREFVYIDQLPRNYEAHWGIEYYKGIYIPKYRPDAGGKNMIEVLHNKLDSKFNDVKYVRNGDLLEFEFDKGRKLYYWINTLLPLFNEFKTDKIIIKNDKKKYYDVDAVDECKYFSKTNLTKEIIDDMLKCNILFIRGFYPSFPIFQMLKLDKIISQDCNIDGYYDGKLVKKEFKSDGIKSTTKKISASGKNYKRFFTVRRRLGFDIRDKILNYNPPISIDCTTNLY